MSHSLLLLTKNCDIAEMTIFFLHDISWIDRMGLLIRYFKLSAAL